LWTCSSFSSWIGDGRFKIAVYVGEASYGKGERSERVRDRQRVGPETVMTGICARSSEDREAAVGEEAQDIETTRRWKAEPVLLATSTG